MKRLQAQQNKNNKEKRIGCDNFFHEVIAVDSFLLFKTGSVQMNVAFYFLPFTSSSIIPTIIEVESVSALCSMASM